MALRKPSFESARCSAGELTFGELGSEVWDRDDRPRVNILRLGRAAMFAKDGSWRGGQGGGQEERKGGCWLATGTDQVRLIK